MRLIETTSSAEAQLGAPWAQPLSGTLDRLVVESELLAGNPLGDPPRRPLYVLCPPGVDLDHPRALPTVYVIQGYLGQLDMWANRNAFEPTVVERVDAVLSDPDLPDALVVFVDAWTAYGGSQFLDSTATGPYQSYLCDEVVPLIDERYPAIADRDHRALTGKSSGGYGALVVPMMRPDVFGALASHAGDTLFEVSMLPGFRESARVLRDDFEGSWELFLQRFAEADPFDIDKYGETLMTYGCAACYSPDPANPTVPVMPFEIETGRLIEEVWQRWLALDPVRIAPAKGEELRSMRRIYLDCGRSDEWFLDLGAKAFSLELDKLGVEHTLELFDGKHGGISYRYPGAIRELILAIAD